jgi:hypothetical protein
MSDTITGAPPVEPEGTPITNEPDLNTREGMISQIGDLREEGKKEHWMDEPISGYKNLLWARFRPFPIEKTEAKIAELRKQTGPILLQSACDVLIDALEQLMLLPARFNGDPGEKGENLIPVDDAVPVRFDQRADELFKVPNPSKSARGTVLGLFATEQAILDLQVRVSRWMVDVTRETDAGLLGN